MRSEAIEAWVVSAESMSGEGWAVHCFKAYDIRGLAYSELDAAFAHRLGRTLATFLDCNALAVGRDIRESSPALHAAFISGLMESGCDVHDIGINTTGALYHATDNLDVDGGVMITASHNPPEYNGFKMCRGTAAMAGDEIQELRAAFEAGEFRGVNRGQRQRGRHIVLTDFTDAYIEAVALAASPILRPVHVVIDAANAVPGPLIERIRERMSGHGAALFCEWDNTFPNHSPDPTRIENMQHLAAAVIETGAEFGVGIDGDGDRVGVVDEKGNFIYPDRILAVIAADILANLPNDSNEEAKTVIYDVKCSMALEQTIRNNGGTPQMMRTGHSFLKQALREKPETPMAGEMSGHFFFNDRWNGFDDSLYALARLMELVARRLPNGEPFSSLFDEIPVFASTGEAKVPLLNGREETMTAVESAFADLPASTVDGVRIRYDGYKGIGAGWFLCRPSNTESILVMRCEADSEESLKTIRDDVDKRIGSVIDLAMFHAA